MTVKELRAVLTLVSNENAEINFSTEPGVAFGISGFEADNENVWILLDTLEWRKQGWQNSQSYDIIIIENEREVMNYED